MRCRRLAKLVNKGRMIIIVTHSKEKKIEQIERACCEGELSVVFVHPSLFFVIEQHCVRRLRLVAVGSESK